MDSFIITISILITVLICIIYKKYRDTQPKPSNELSVLNSEDILTLCMFLKEIREWINIQFDYFNTIEQKLTETNNARHILTYDENPDFDLNEACKRSELNLSGIKVNMQVISAILKESSLSDKYVKNISETFNTICKMMNDINSLIKEEKIRLESQELYSIKQMAYMISIRECSDYLCELDDFHREVIEIFEERNEEIRLILEKQNQQQRNQFNKKYSNL